MAAVQSSSTDVDESLYSRQLYVMGHEAQRRMAVSSVLMVGLNGLGVETAKNVILAGVKSVTLYDNTPASNNDLSSQFYISENDIGKRRDAVSLPKLAELNPYVELKLLDISIDDTITSIISHNTLSNYTAVVLIDQSLEVQQAIAEECHKLGIAILIGDVRGVFGSIFCDFGETFTVSDTTGEPLASSMLAGITQDYPALVTVLEETRHGLETGNKVIFSDIVGMEELNGTEFIVTVKDSYSFEINVDTRGYNIYQRGGYCNQIKIPVDINFKSISASYADPCDFICDWVKLDHAPVLHIAFRALHVYNQRHSGAYPSPGHSSDAQELFDICIELNTNGDYKIDESHLRNHEKLVKSLALTCQGLISPICALIGGILGQEILKAVSGKFMPIKQWLYYDAIEVLPEMPLSIEEVTPTNSRYDSQIIVFGKTLQAKIASLNMFLVGAGAIGCEMIKNWALMGVATSNNACVHITDMDHIEKSNLSRQFLFRNHNIGHQKSTSAAKAAALINASMKSISYEMKVAPETESFFNDDFFECMDMICTALDNVEARLYIDQRCLFYHKPMLESGTLGTKGHTQIVVPGITEHYGATRDPPEKSIPLCTLKSFPNQIEHTLQWAREWFEEIYNQTPADVNQYLNSSSSDFTNSLASQQNMRLETLNRIKDSLCDSNPKDFSDCIVWARMQFEGMFVNRIKQLLYNFPVDKMTASGTMFWSGAKKAPTALDFSVNDPLHLEFIKATAAARATCYQISRSSSDGDGVDAIYYDVLSKLVIPIFNPSDGIAIAATEEEAKNSSNSSQSNQYEDIDVTCSNLINELPAPAAMHGFNMKPIEFDKDVDDHMRVVAACSNLRARNYRIPEADLHTSRGIAGKITPAIATTTALVTGAICLEIYKLIQGKSITSYHNSFANLAVPLFTNMEPNPAKVTRSVIKGSEWKWTQWDRIDLTNPQMRLCELLKYFEDTYSLEISMLSSGVSILYSNFMNRKKLAERMDMTLKEVVESVSKKQFPTSQKYLIFEVIVNDIDTGDEVDIPYVRFKLF